MTPQGLSVGQPVTVQPDVNGGEQPVAGTLRYADAETVVIERSAEGVGNVCVHFPRSGYRDKLAVMRSDTQDQEMSNVNHHMERAAS